MPFPHLTAPLDAGRLHLKNRTVFPGHQTLMSHDGVVGDTMYRYYLERAKGGVGAVVVEGAAVHPSAPKFPNYLYAYDEAIVPSLDRLADGLHEHDCKAIVQLAHSGSRMPSLDSQRPLWAPSDVRSAISPEFPHAMTEAEIAELLDGYLLAARNVGRSGADGVEFHSAHEYLPGQFLSPVNNLRTDRWGGSLDNRMRFLLEGLARVREGLGDDKVLGVRINGSDLRDDGVQTGEYVEIARRLEASGLVDYISVSAGTSAANHLIVPPMDVEQRVFTPYAAAIKAAVTSVPVFAVGRLKRPETAEALLAAGEADVVAEARAFIADPEWLNKLVSAPETVRPCIACNQGCFGNLYLNRRLTCSVNPAVGREAELGLGTVPTIAVRRRVAVVGGGPGGMEAAISAASRGHDVTLFEATGRLGGQVLLATAVPARTELGEIVDFQVDELKRLGVDVRLGTRAHADDLAGYDAVVTATGSTPRPAAFGAALTPEEAIGSTEDWSERDVVVIDDVGHFAAYLPAELMADRGARVVVATAKLTAGTGLDSATMMTMHMRLARKGVEFLVHAAPVSAPPGEVTFRDTLSGVSLTRRADAVVAAVGNRAADALAHELRGRAGSDEGPDLHLVGDCVAPRTITEAIREGRLVGRAL
ncbi:MAG: FAD-dependent oxidoreductase [Pseudonocardiaceae bacterium]|nr:MAG: FAD-dependent oxidoreductase [Pseudonocardiaceae bacterium]